MPARPVGPNSLSIRPFTSAEAGAWSNAYLISGATEAILFDVVMLRSDAVKLAELIVQRKKTPVTRVVIILQKNDKDLPGSDRTIVETPSAHGRGGRSSNSRRF